MGEKRNAYGILVGKHEGDRLLRRPKCKYEDNFKKGLQEIRWNIVDMINLA